MCLKDLRRTSAFRAAIHKTVRRDDVVLDAGAGTGILSLFAIEAGAKKVYCAEIDEYLCDCLRRTVRANGLASKVEVICADVRQADIPNSVDVVIAEMIETGLIDELQVPTINSLFERGVVTPRTRFIPESYRTKIRMVSMHHDSYGYKIMAPHHEWPFYADAKTKWAELRVVRRSGSVEVWKGRFAEGPLTEAVDRSISVALIEPGPVNGVMLHGTATLAPRINLGACNAMNGDKLFPFDQSLVGANANLRISYSMGGGLGTLSVAVEMFY